MAPEPHYVDVDLKRNTNYKFFSVTQNDTDVTVIVRVSDNGLITDTLLDYFTTFTLTSVRPQDKKAFYVPGEKIAETNEVSFNLGTSELANTGKVEASVQLYSVDGRMSTAHFTYEVRKDHTGEYVPSENEATLIETVLVDGPRIMSETEAATLAAIQATENLETDKAAALTEMSTATQGANTAATNADTERVRMVNEVTQIVTDVDGLTTYIQDDFLPNTALAISDMDLVVQENTAVANDAKTTAEGVETQFHLITSEGPVQSVNGQTGIIEGLALQSELNETNATLADTEKKVTGSISILKFEHLVLNKGQATEDWKDALQAAKVFLEGSDVVNRLVFPAGIYQYSVSPNWAIQNAIIDSDGEVRFRYTGINNAVDIDGGVETGMAFNINFGRFIIECPSTAKNALFVRAIHHSNIKAVVLGAGAAHAGLRVEWCVCTNFEVNVTNNHQGWYLDAKPLYGYYIDKRALQPVGQGGYTSWCKFTNPIVEGCQFGIYIDRGQGNSFYSGTSEGHSKKGIVLTANSLYNKFIGLDMEVNVEHDIYCLGKENEFISCDATGIHLFDGFAKDNVMIGGSHNQLTLGTDTFGNMLQNIKYNRFNNGSVINDISGKNRLMSNRNVGLNRTENRPPSSSAITVGASPFTYVNQSGNDEMIHIIGGTISQFQYVHGAYGDVIGSSPQFIRLCPGDSIKVTYSVAPTIRKYTT